MNTKTAQLIALINDAKAAFTGIDWDTGPSSAAIAMASAWENAAARDAAVADGEDGRWERAEIGKALSRAVEPEGGTFWREDGSYSSQCLDRDWRDLGREVEALHDESSVEDIETARQHAEWIADAEARAVEGNAEAADEYGDDAIAAAEAGDWDAAVAALEEACRCEREYGDDPSWGPALKLARELADAADDDEDDYDEIVEGDVPDDVQFDVSGVNQGQMIEIATGGPYKRETNRATGVVTYWVRDDYEG